MFLSTSISQFPRPLRCWSSLLVLLLNSSSPSSSASTCANALNLHLHKSSSIVPYTPSSAGPGFELHIRPTVTAPSGSGDDDHESHDSGISESVLDPSLPMSYRVFPSPSFVWKAGHERGEAGKVWDKMLNKPGEVTLEALADMILPSDTMRHKSGSESESNISKSGYTHFKGGDSETKDFSIHLAKPHYTVSRVSAAVWFPDPSFKFEKPPPPSDSFNSIIGLVASAPRPMILLCENLFAGYSRDELSHVSVQKALDKHSIESDSGSSYMHWNDLKFVFVVEYGKAISDSSSISAGFKAISDSISSNLSKINAAAGTAAAAVSLRSPAALVSNANENFNPRAVSAQGHEAVTVGDGEPNSDDEVPVFLG